jgi:hypothetical protein
MKMTQNIIKSEGKVGSNNDLKNRFIGPRALYDKFYIPDTLIDRRKEEKSLYGLLTDAIKESSFDCYIYSNGKCINFGDPSNDKFAYVPDFADQQNDTTVQANKKRIEWVGKPVNINEVDYIYRRVNEDVLDLYDKDIYERDEQLAAMLLEE